LRAMTPMETAAPAPGSGYPWPPPQQPRTDPGAYLLSG